MKIHKKRSKKTMRGMIGILLCLTLAFSCCFLSSGAVEISYESTTAYKFSDYYRALSDVELTGDYRADIINLAMSQIGYHEGDCLADLGGGNIYGAGNYTEYGSRMQCEAAWCAMFISWCARQAQIPCEVIGDSYYATAYDFGLEYGSREEYTPKPGDLIIFDWEYDGFNPAEPAGEHGDHVGLVFYVDEENVYYVDGNFGNCISRHYTALDDINLKGYGIFPTDDDDGFDELMFAELSADAEQYVLTQTGEESLLLAAANPFEDVLESDYFYSAVMWSVFNNNMPDIIDELFEPYRDCTRAEYVTFLWSACGQPEPEMTENPFRDADETGFYYKAMLWCYENGYVFGTGWDAFSPDMTTDRAQIVTVLHRIVGLPSAEAECVFEDVDEDAYYYDAVLWAIESGVTAGTTPTTFSPELTCDRAQMLCFLHRLMAT